MDKFLSYKNFLNNKKKLISKKNKFAVITGGCGRIGSVFIGQLLYNGYKTICLSKTEKKCLEYKKTLPANLKKNLIWHPLDLISPKTVDNAVKFIFKNFSCVDVLINNAAESNRGKNFKYSVNSLGKEFWGTFGSSFLLTEKILPIMRRKEKGKIITTGSLWGSYAVKFKTYLGLDIGPSPMTASGKAAIMQYTKHLASREAEFSITANALLPGFFPRKGPVERKDYIKSINSNIPLNRIGQLEDLISAVDFLISEGSSYITGQFIIVDGGYTAW